ncbi:uncharacterized protein SCHCODRAFT_02588879 [Schizophyllum commune H4-8]|uniref:Uncharacterized protein n=1 Tax=Schizophyllum commune (strain H4-8 / FGSC 9210) TaxID=578458 RepID=D8QF86_SCHCM|nr:uncharacterized protein SCHCODRAFT_02588879 [Schizophyllum commune H4-8]KAI5887535.1 hypothetical protein SCHCODRAFT_02588879 [Schizophyllum commune H4-8]
MPGLSDFKFNYIGREPGLLSRFSDAPAGDATYDEDPMNGMDVEDSNTPATSGSQADATHIAGAEANAFAPPDIPNRRRSLLERIDGYTSVANGVADRFTNNTTSSPRPAASTSTAINTASTSLFRNTPVPPPFSFPESTSNVSALSNTSENLQLHYPPSVQPSPSRDGAPITGASFSSASQTQTNNTTSNRTLADIHELRTRMSTTLSSLSTPTSTSTSSALTIAEDAASRASKARDDARGAHKASQSALSEAKTNVITARAALETAERACCAVEAAVEAAYAATQTSEDAQRRAAEAVEVVRRMGEEQERWKKEVEALQGDLARLDGRLRVLGEGGGGNGDPGVPMEVDGESARVGEASGAHAISHGQQLQHTSNGSTSRSVNRMSSTQDLSALAQGIPQHFPQIKPNSNSSAQPAPQVSGGGPDANNGGHRAGGDGARASGDESGVQLNGTGASFTSAHSPQPPSTTGTQPSQPSSTQPQPTSSTQSSHPTTSLQQPGMASLMPGRLPLHPSESQSQPSPNQLDAASSTLPTSSSPTAQLSPIAMLGSFLSAGPSSSLTDHASFSTLGSSAGLSMLGNSALAAEAVRREAFEYIRRAQAVKASGAQAQPSGSTAQELTASAQQYHQAQQRQQAEAAAREAEAAAREAEAAEREADVAAKEAQASKDALAARLAAEKEKAMKLAAEQERARVAEKEKEQARAIAAQEERMRELAAKAAVLKEEQARLAAEAAARKEAAERAEAEKRAEEEVKQRAEAEANQQAELEAKQRAEEEHRAELIRKQDEMRLKILHDKEVANLKTAAEIRARRAMASASPPAPASAMDFKMGSPAPSTPTTQAPPSISSGSATSLKTNHNATPSTGNYVAQQTLVPTGSATKKKDKGKAKPLSGNVKLGVPDDVVRAAELGLRPRNTSGEGSSAAQTSTSKMPTKPYVEVPPMKKGSASASASTSASAGLERVKSESKGPGTPRVKQEGVESPLAGSSSSVKPSLEEKMPAPALPAKNNNKAKRTQQQQQRQQQLASTSQSQPAASVSTPSAPAHPASTRPAAVNASQEHQRQPSAASTASHAGLAAPPKPTDRRRPQTKPATTAQPSAPPTATRFERVRQQQLAVPQSTSARGPRTPPLPPPSMSTSIAPASYDRSHSPEYSRSRVNLRASNYQPASPSRGYQISPPVSPRALDSDRRYRPAGGDYFDRLDAYDSRTYGSGPSASDYHAAGQKRPRDVDFDERPAQRVRTESGSRPYQSSHWSPDPPSPNSPYAQPSTSYRRNSGSFAQPETVYDRAAADALRGPYDPMSPTYGDPYDADHSYDYADRGYDTSYGSDPSGMMQYNPEYKSAAKQPAASGSKGSLRDRLGDPAPAKQGKGRGGHNTSSRGKGRGGGKASLSSRIQGGATSLLDRMT